MLLHDNVYKVKKMFVVPQIYALFLHEREVISSQYGPRKKSYCAIVLPTDDKWLALRNYDEERSDFHS